MKPTIVYIDNFLTEAGHTPTTGIGLVKLFKEIGYNVKISSSKKNKVIRMAGMWSAIFYNRKNSVVIIATYSTSAFYFAWSCAKLCKYLKVPYIPCLHGGNLPNRIINSPLKSAALFGCSFTNVTVSGYLGNALQKHGYKQIEISNFIIKENYPFHHRKKAEPHLLWVRSFHEIYNPELAVHILYLLKQKYPASTLTMVGPVKDESFANCKLLAAELNIDDAIQFTGLLSQKDWVKLSVDQSFLINTTNFDNLPVSVIEAMALGLIIVSTDVGGMPYLLSHKKNGFLVSKNDATAFIKSIQEVLNDEHLTFSLSLAANTTAMEYDYQKIKTKWISLLNTISFQKN